MKKQMTNEEETIQYLADKDHLKEFILELQQFLKTRVAHYRNDKGEICYTSKYDPYDARMSDRKEFFIKFCNKKRLDWGAVHDLLFDQMGSFLCDYDLIYDLEIDDQGNVVYK